MIIKKGTIFANGLKKDPKPVVVELCSMTLICSMPKHSKNSAGYPKNI